MSFYIFLSSGVDVYYFRFLCHLASCNAPWQNIVTLSLCLHAFSASEVCMYFIETLVCVRKVQLILENAMKAHKGNRGMAVFYF